MKNFLHMVKSGTTIAWNGHYYLVIETDSTNYAVIMDCHWNTYRMNKRWFNVFACECIFF